MNLSTMVGRSSRNRFFRISYTKIGNKPKSHLDRTNFWAKFSIFSLRGIKRVKFWLKYIMRTFIHPSNGDSTYSPFHSPFLKGESPFLKGEWASERKIRPSKGWKYWSLGVNQPQKEWMEGWIGWNRVIHPSEGWIAKKSDLKKVEWRANHPSQGWMKTLNRL